MSCLFSMVSGASGGALAAGRLESPEGLTVAGGAALTEVPSPD